MRLSTSQWKSRAAFSLVEVALALGVAGFCLVAVIGLVPVGVDTAQQASDQAAASSILSHVLADLRATPALPEQPAQPPGSPEDTKTVSRQYALPIPYNKASTTAAAPVFAYFGNSADEFFYPSQTPTSTSTPPVGGGSRYRLSVQFLPTAGGRTATGVRLMVSWPASVDPFSPTNGRPTGRVQIFAALDRN